MGKRKSRAKPVAKKRTDKLDTVFSCPFCNHGTSVECRIDMKNLIGEAICGICGESFSTTITAVMVDSIYRLYLKQSTYTANGSMNVSESTIRTMMIDHTWEDQMVDYRSYKWTAPLASKDPIK